MVAEMAGMKVEQRAEPMAEQKVARLVEKKALMWVGMMAVKLVEMKVDQKAASLADKKDVPRVVR